MAPIPEPPNPIGEQAAHATSARQASRRSCAMADGRGQRDAQFLQRRRPALGSRRGHSTRAPATGRRCAHPGPGGESTAPGSRPITYEEELLRIEPVVRGLAHGVAVVSIDTYHAATAARCIELGRKSSMTCPACAPTRDGGRGPRPRAGAGDDARQGWPAAARDRSAGAVRRRGAGGRRLAGGAGGFCLAAGIDADQLVLDPGWGKFLSLDPAHSWELLARFDELDAAPRRCRCWSASRARAHRRVGGRADALSQLASLAAAAKSAALIRTHAVGMAAQFRRRRPAMQLRCRRRAATLSRASATAARGACAQTSGASRARPRKRAPARSRALHLRMRQPRAATVSTRSSTAMRSRSIRRGRQRAVGDSGPGPGGPRSRAGRPGGSGAKVVRTQHGTVEELRVGLGRIVGVDQGGGLQPRRAGDDIAKLGRHQRHRPLEGRRAVTQICPKGYCCATGRGVGRSWHGPGLPRQHPPR